jgi:23S rRNA pseudouridine2604 synthase
MPRSTLKLPAKAPVAKHTDDSIAAPRKPLRGGAKVAKQSVAQRDSALAAKAARFAAEAGAGFNRKPRPPVEARTEQNPAAPRSPARPMHPTPADNTERPRSARSVQEPRTPEIAKAYPKRGIARSTGARALPPARPPRDESTPQAPAEAVVVAAVTTPVPERPAAPMTTPSQAERPPRRAAPRAPRAAQASRTPHAAPTHDATTAVATTNTTAVSAAVTNTRRPLNEPPRLSKQISEMSQCSRREADEWIENGWVRVDGVVINTLGTRVHPNAKIEILPAASTHQTESVTILLNKPLDEDNVQDEEGAERAIQLIRPENRWSEDDSRLSFKATHLRGLARVSKLDAGTTGMLVFTQEGSVARRITGDETRLEKEYMVRVEGELSEAGLKQLNFGLTLDDVKLKRAQVSWQNEQQLRFVLHESKKQQIQRMCELVGLRVTSIKRIRIGSVSLGKLPPGQWRYLRENERF